LATKGFLGKCRKNSLRDAGKPLRRREDANMLNQRRKQKLPDYGVQFIGYSARIIARKGNAEFASLDFVSGTCAQTKVTCLCQSAPLCLPLSLVCRAALIS
jgi:hypothetical protein